MKLAIYILLSSTLSAVSVPTAHYDNNRTGSTTSEILLKPTSPIVKLGTYAVNGAVYAQELYVKPTGISKTCVIVVTMRNNVYCFDAGIMGGAPIWGPVNLGSPRTSYPTVGSASDFFYGQPVGCVSTPVADVTNNKLHVVCTNTTPTWTWNVLNLSTGAVLSTTVIDGSVVGTGTTGDPTSGPNLLFYPGQELQRSPLLLLNGIVYIAFAGYDDRSPWHGWVFAYDAVTLAQTGIMCTTPNGSGGGIWQAGGGPAGNTDIYFTTGNGTWDGVTEFSQSALRLQASTLAIVDWFTPADHAATDAVDADLSSGRVVIIPGTNHLTFGSKDFRVWNLDANDMGHLQGGGGTAPQVFYTNALGTPGPASGIYGGLFMNNSGLFPNINGKLYAFAYNTGTNLYNTTPVTTSGNLRIQGMTGSSNGTSDGIVWITTSATSAYAAAVAGTLRALNPTTLVEIWNSDTVVTDALGTISKFSSPTVADGHVYVSTQDGVVAIYGSPPSSGLSIGGLVRISGLSAVGGVAGSAAAGGVTPPVGAFSFRRSITIDHTKVPNTDQTNFAVLISGTYSYLATVANGGKVQSPSGFDVFFASDTGCVAALNYETETWSATTGVVNYWVKLSSISHTVDTVFYLCYGNSSINSFQGNVAGTWNSNYNGVFHVGNGTTLSGTDSTGIQNLSLNSTVATTGRIDGGAAITATHYLYASDATLYPGSEAGPCISIWLKTTQTAQTAVLAYGRDTANNQFYLYLQQFSGSDYRVGVGIGAGSIALSDAAANDGAFHYFVGTVDTGSGAQTGRIYMDGTQRATGSFSWLIDENFNGLTIGRLFSGLQTLDGTVDEARISHNSCSADQISTEYNNQSSPSTFYTIGAEVPL